MLRLKVPMEPNEQDQDGDGDEGCAEGFAYVAEARGGVGGEDDVRGGEGRVLVGDGGVEAEELGYGDADGGEGEGGAEPG